MARFHFLNVKNGDCSIIEHDSGHVSIVDVCNARLERNKQALSLEQKMQLHFDAIKLASATEARKNYGQKANPVNPIEHLQDFGIRDLFRLAITHPDMDHMDGLEDLFAYSTPTNYYDTSNNKQMTDGWEESPYREEDWLLYKHLRDSPPKTDPKAIRIYSGDDGIHRRRDWKGNPPGDALFTLAPTPTLVAEANDVGEYNDASYVFMFWSTSGRIILSGDSHDRSWDHILENHVDLVENVELLIAPHHGRKSGRSYKFLDVLCPKMTFFGNAPSKDLAYSAWRSRGLPFITNNMAGSMIVDCSDNMSLYVTNEQFARDENARTFYSDSNRGWYIREISPAH